MRRFLPSNNTQFIKKKKNLKKCANRSHFCSKVKSGTLERREERYAQQKKKRKRSCTFLRLNSEHPEQQDNGICQGIISDYFGRVFDSLAFLKYITVSFVLFSQTPEV